MSRTTVAARAFLKKRRGKSGFSDASVRLSGGSSCKPPGKAEAEGVFTSVSYNYYEMNSCCNMSKLKSDMISLWKETFMDSDDYINIVFDNYFNSDNCFFVYDNDVLVSDMLCIPYKFEICNNMYPNADYGKKNNEYYNADYVKELTTDKYYSLKFSYLCGLATRYNYRCRGIMTSLIRKSNRCLFENGFTLSVLIPSDEEKSLYYGKFGYVGITYICTNDNEKVETYFDNIIKKFNIKVFDNIIFINDYISGKIYDIHNDFKFDYNDKSLRNNKDLLWFYSCYSALKCRILGCNVSHSIADFIAILYENFSSGGKVLLMVDEHNVPLAILFCSINEDRTAVVQLLLSDSEKSKAIILAVLKSSLSDSVSLAVREYELNNSVGVVKDNENTSVKPYAMAKILNVAEVLKFVAALYPNSEFSILINHDEFEENEGIYHVKSGQLSFQQLKDISGRDYREAEEVCRNSSDKYILTVPELAAILFRQEGNSGFGKSGISEMAIPRISLNVALMLD